MTLEDLLYRLGDAIGWDHCDYARDRAGDAYGITDGYATLALTLDGDTVYWGTYAITPDGVDPLDEGGVPRRRHHQPRAYLVRGDRRRSPAHGARDSCSLTARR